MWSQKNVFLLPMLIVMAKNPFARNVDTKRDKTKKRFFHGAHKKVLLIVLELIFFNKQKKVFLTELLIVNELGQKWFFQSDHKKCNFVRNAYNFRIMAKKLIFHNAHKRRSFARNVDTKWVMTKNNFLTKMLKFNEIWPKNDFFMVIRKKVLCSKYW